MAYVMITAINGTCLNPFMIIIIACTRRWYEAYAKHCANIRILLIFY